MNQLHYLLEELSKYSNNSPITVGDLKSLIADALIAENNAKKKFQLIDNQEIVRENGC